MTVAFPKTARFTGLLPTTTTPPGEVMFPIIYCPFTPRGRVLPGELQAEL
jgi:hypothetical protein